MIVSCTKCAVKLKVDENKVKPGGSKLKCPKCQNIFMVFRPEEQAAQGASLPGMEPSFPVPPPPPQPQAAPQAPPYPPQPQAPPQAPPYPPQPQAAPQAPPYTPQPQAPVYPPRPQAAPAAAPPEPRWELDRRKVLIGYNGDTVSSLMSDMLTRSGFETIVVSDGVEAMLQLERQKPAVAILDVALPSIFGFEICDRIKKNPASSDLKIILIASIFDKTKYKRAPTSLYGADDYIEKHHIEEFIVKKVNRMLSPAGAVPGFREEEATAPPTPEVAMVRQQHATEMRREEMTDIPAPSAVDPKQSEAARRFARIILSDIALYNQAAVEEGIRSDTFQSLMVEELKEGRELYNSRVPAEVRQSMDYFAEELENFIEKKKRLMEMGG